MSSRKLTPVSGAIVLVLIFLCAIGLSWSMFDDSPEWQFPESQHLCEAMELDGLSDRVEMITDEYELFDLADVDSYERQQYCAVEFETVDPNEELFVLLHFKVTRLGHCDDEEPRGFAIAERWGQSDFVDVVPGLGEWDFDDVRPQSYPSSGLISDGSEFESMRAAGVKSCHEGVTYDAGIERRILSKNDDDSGRTLDPAHTEEGELLQVLYEIRTLGYGTMSVHEASYWAELFSSGD